MKAYPSMPCLKYSHFQNQARPGGRNESQVNYTSLALTHQHERRQRQVTTTATTSSLNGDGIRAFEGVSQEERTLIPLSFSLDAKSQNFGKQIITPTATVAPAAGA